jgi:hypothetical protein
MKNKILETKIQTQSTTTIQKHFMSKFGKSIAPRQKQVLTG